MVDTMATRVQARMDELKLKPVDLAKRIDGMTASAISQFLNGKTKGLKPNNLIDIAEALDCTPRWIVYGVDTATPYRPAPAPKAVLVSENLPPLQVHTARQMVDQLGEAIDHCAADSRAAVAGLLQQYALSPKPGAIADAIVMFLERCVNPNIDNPFANAPPVPTTTAKPTKKAR